MMKTSDLKEGARVRVVAGSRDWHTPVEHVGREGRIRDADGGTVYVVFDRDSGPGYWAFPSELEAITGGDPIPVLDASRGGVVVASAADVAAVVSSQSPRGAKS